MHIQHIFLHIFLHIAAYFSAYYAYFPAYCFIFSCIFYIFFDIFYICFPYPAYICKIWSGLSICLVSIGFNEFSIKLNNSKPSVPAGALSIPEASPHESMRLEGAGVLWKNPSICRICAICKICLGAHKYMSNMCNMCNMSQMCNMSKKAYIKSYT